MTILPGNVNHYELKQETESKHLTAVAISAVDRNGNESKRRIVELKREEK